MASLSAAIAAALKTDLDGQSWPVTVTSFREYLAPIRRADLGAQVRASIFPYTLAPERASRASISRLHGIGLVLRAAATPSDIAAVDLLVETVELMADRYLFTAIGASTPESVEMLNGSDIYDVDRLGQDQLFQGGLIITVNTRT